MCTVTYIPKADGCYLTSSRDEKAVRARALHPSVYQHNGQQLLYPKDAAAGGTWICAAGTGTAGVLLNGAFVKHTPQQAYRRSRGLIFLEILSSYQPHEAFNNIDLTAIEPFTLVLFWEQQLVEYRWDGYQKHTTAIDATARHIWSSVTLYADEIVQERNTWFNHWSAANPVPGQQHIIAFHKFGGNGNLENSILMNRDNKLLTVSITSIHLSADNANMFYYDLQPNGGFNQRQLSFNRITQV